MNPYEKFVVFTDIGGVDDWSAEYFVAPRNLDLRAAVDEWRAISVMDRDRCFQHWLYLKGCRPLNEQDTEIAFITNDEGEWSVEG